MKIREITPADDLALADIIRTNLKAHALDIPGTAYYDEHLNHLSGFYLMIPGDGVSGSKSETVPAGGGRFYGIVVDDEDKVVGGIGLAEFENYEDCCELQKLYLADEVKGTGYSYEMISFIESKAKELGYKRIYLETHDNLPAAIHVYERSGYREIERPDFVVHSTMNRFFVKELA